MHVRHSLLPLVWLVSDARNDAGLENALRRLPPGSGFVFRHYHLSESERRARFDELACIARSEGHHVALSRGRGWGETFAYGSMPPIDDAPWLATVHDGLELDRAIGTGAVGAFLSPVFDTRSHPVAPVLGVHGFSVLAQRSPIPVIALGGMTAQRARQLDWPRWGAIDGLADTQDA